MPDISSYSHVTQATVPDAVFSQAWRGIVSWKGYLQAFPGFLYLRVSARALAEPAVRVLVAVGWEHLEQLELWRDSDWSADRLLARLDQPVADVTHEVFEDLS